MNPEVRKDVDLETLLRARPGAGSGTDAEAEAEDMERVALGLSKQASPAEKHAAREQLRQCPECMEALLTLHALQDEGVVPPAEVQRVDFSPREHRFSGWRQISAAAAALVLVALAVVMAWYLSASPGSGEDSLVAKGPTERIFIAVERDNKSFTLHQGERLLAGDRVQVFYSAKRDGYLLALNLDSTGNLSVLVPAKGERSLAVKAGERRPLSGAGIVRKGQGWEWIVAVFSDQAMKAEEWKKILRRSWKARSGSRISVPTGDARTVQVLAIPR